MDVPSALTGMFSLFRRRPSVHSEDIVADSVDDLIRQRFGKYLSDEQVKAVIDQGWIHLIRIRNDARSKNLEPDFYIADALRHADFKPELNLERYERERRFDRDVLLRVYMGR